MIDIATATEELEGCLIRRPGSTCEVRKDMLEAVIARNRALSFALETTASQLRVANRLALERT